MVRLDRKREEVDVFPSQLSAGVVDEVTPGSGERLPGAMDALIVAGWPAEQRDPHEVQEPLRSRLGMGLHHGGGGKGHGVGQRDRLVVAEQPACADARLRALASRLSLSNMSA